MMQDPDGEGVQNRVNMQSFCREMRYVVSDRTMVRVKHKLAIVGVPLHLQTTIKTVCAHQIVLYTMQ